MTNPIAIFLAIAVTLAVIADQYFLDGSGGLLAAKKFAEFIEWIAFWR